MADGGALSRAEKINGHQGNGADDPQSEHFRELVAAAVNRDPVATRQVLVTVTPMVVRYCRARLGRINSSFSSADDVVQEVCLSIVAALPRFRDQGQPFLAFVYGIAAHKVADARRAMLRNRCLSVAEFPDQQLLDDTPEQHILRQELAGQLTRLLGQLTPNQQEIVRLRAVVGLSAEETAKLVGSTAGAVRVAQHRAMNRLREGLLAEAAADLALVGG